MNTILIVKTSALGDIIHCFPVLEYLRQKYPAAQIDWVVEESFKDLVQAHPYVNKVIAINTRKWRKFGNIRDNWSAIKSCIQTLRQKQYELVIDLQGNIKSGIFTFLAKGQDKVGFGRETVAERPNLLVTKTQYNPPLYRNIREDYLYIAQAYLNDNSPFTPTYPLLKIEEQDTQVIEVLLSHPILQGKKKFLVCPGSRWPNKQLSEKEWRPFLSKLTKTLSCSLLFLWGNDDEELFAQQLQEQFPTQSLVLPYLTLPVLQNLMTEVDLVISMDSMPLHLCGTTSTPSFSVFGASSASKYQPIGQKHYALQGSCPYGQMFEKRCPKLRSCPTGACIREMPYDRLFEEFIKWYATLTLSG
ncbi:MAG: waaC [Chlamydiales bacterium]|nr:waaC [Chlamydiales bacterium]